MSHSVSKRRTIFIKKAFQSRFIAGALGLVLLSSLSSALFIYWVTGGELQNQPAQTGLISGWERLGLSLFLGNLVAVVVAGSAAVASALYASHKIAGPLYRFERLCEDVGSGNLDTSTQLRDGDQLQELALSFANMRDNLRNRRDQRIRLIGEINHHIGLFALRGGDGLLADQQNVIANLANLTTELEKLDQ